MAANLQKSWFRARRTRHTRGLGDATSQRRCQVGQQSQVAGGAITSDLHVAARPLEVEAVALGSNGLLERMEKGSAWFDLTTNSPTLVRRLHRAKTGACTCLMLR